MDAPVCVVALVLVERAQERLARALELGQPLDLLPALAVLALVLAELAVLCRPARPQRFQGLRASALVYRAARAHLHLVVRPARRLAEGIEGVALPFVGLVLPLVVLKWLVSGDLVAKHPAVGLGVVNVAASLPVYVAVDVREDGRVLRAVDLEARAEVVAADDYVSSPGVPRAEGEKSLVRSLAAPDDVWRSEPRNVRNAEEARNPLEAHVSFPPVALSALLCPMIHAPDGMSASRARSGMYSVADSVFPVSSRPLGYTVT